MKSSKQSYTDMKFVLGCCAMFSLVATLCGSAIVYHQQQACSLEEARAALTASSILKSDDASTMKLDNHRFLKCRFSPQARDVMLVETIGVASPFSVASRLSRGVTGVTAAKAANKLIATPYKPDSGEMSQIVTLLSGYMNLRARNEALDLALEHGKLQTAATLVTHGARPASPKGRDAFCRAQSAGELNRRVARAIDRGGYGAILQGHAYALYTTWTCRPFALRRAPLHRPGHS